MKIALITIHWANSYGGMLQALASQTILSKYGEVSIIDYKTEHLDKSMKLFRYGYNFRDFLRMGKDLFRILPRYRLLKEFKNFASENYMLTPLCRDTKDLEKLEKDYDVFICGSDQIWNPNIINNFDGAYFLNFIQNKKKVAYASSAGTYKFNNEEEDTLRKYLNKFSNIALREKDTADYIRKILNRDDIENVLDPTLMLNKSEWFNLLSLKETPKKIPYVFVYTLRKDSFVREIVNKVSKKLKLKVIVIDQDPYLGYDADEHIKDAGPKQYLELLSNASFVITNSFHGTVFSTNFEVPFISIKPESGLNRMENFLKNVNLRERLVLDNNDIDTIITAPINFNISSNKLEQLKNNSWEYLNKAFQKEQ